MRSKGTLKYIVASTPEELLARVVDYVKDKASVGEKLDVSYSVDYDTDADTWTLKIRVNKSPNPIPAYMSEDSVVQSLPKADPIGIAPMQASLSIPAQTNDNVFYGDRDVIDTMLQRHLGYRIYNVNGRHVQAFSLVSAIRKYVDETNLPVKVAGHVAHEEASAMKLLFISEVGKRVATTTKTSNKKQAKLEVDEVVEKLFGEELTQQEVTASKEDEDVFIMEAGQVEALTNNEVESVDDILGDMLVVADGVVDLKEVKASVENTEEEEKIFRHPLEEAFENTFPFVKSAHYNPENGIVELDLDGDAKLRWLIGFDEKEKKVNVGKLTEALKKTVSVKYTDFAKEDTPLWQLKEENGKLVLVPVGGE